MIMIGGNAVPEELGDVYYLQSQNGNLYTSQGDDVPSELDALLADVPKEVPWASKALGKFCFLILWPEYYR